MAKTDTHWIATVREIVRGSSVPVGDREDVVQEVLLRSLRHEGGASSEARSTRLARTIFRRLRIDAWRRRSESQLTGDQPTDGGGPDIDALRCEMRSRIRAAVDQLTARQREVIELRDYDGLRFHDIAERLDVPMGTVLGRGHAGLIKLREILREDGESNA